MQTLRILKDEHRTLGAVLQALRFLLREIRARRMAPDFRLLGAMLYYVDTFPERFHHPKEDAYLFRLLRLRCHEAHELIERLEEEHRAGQRQMLQLYQALTRYEQGGEPEFYAFEELAQLYVDFEFEHMRTEEAELMPLAEKHLAAQDWEEVDRAFLDHQDPLFGLTAAEGFQHLFSRIVNLAPPPIGVGPAAAPATAPR